MSSNTSNALPLTVLNGEPRVYDITLGERLGFERPRDIRKIIKRNEAKLLTFGGCATVARVVEGNETTEFYLNQKQALFVCMKSETDRAFDVQADIVRVYDTYLSGDLKPAPQKATVVGQPRLTRDLAYTCRIFDRCQDVFTKKMLATSIQHIADQIGIPSPDVAFINQPVSQYRMEI